MNFILGLLGSAVAAVIAVFYVLKKTNIADDMASTDHNPVVVASVVPPEAPKQPIQPVSNPGIPPRIDKWATAIAHWEGANPTSNNPGNLKYSTLTASWGATKGHPAADGGFFCHFATPEAGHKALCNFLLLGAEGQLIISHPEPCTFRQFTVRFAGNPPEGYIQGIAKELGVSTDTPISTLLA